MMFTATPVRKPSITEWDTNRVYRPRRRIPATTKNPPASSVSRVSAPARWASSTTATPDPAASDAALVVVMTISWVLEPNPPINGPIALAYRPDTGLTPARTPEAIPSGTLLIAFGRPATRSARRFSLRGATLRSQPVTGETTLISVGRRCQPATTRKPRLPVELSGVFELRAATR